MTAHPNAAQLGPMLKARRRAKRLTLRELADETGVSLNTLSRVERGHMPDLKNFQRIVDWLDVPAERFHEQVNDQPSTPQVIARLLNADQQLTPQVAQRMASVVEEMYRNLTRARPQVAVHLRSAGTFTPAAGALLSEILSDMQASLLSQPPT
jgi:transcriptional regulator with XRE-family HTH domain